MTKSVALHSLCLCGPFRLEGPEGNRVPIKSKKGQALIAMLAVANNGERTRSWLQDRLWGSRGAEQAQSSLRSELAALRKILDTSLINADHDRVWIDLEALQVDVRGPETNNRSEFLEGMDIAGEELFEDWLREERICLSDKPVAKMPTLILKPDNFEALPAIAVLPFVNLTGASDNEFLAEGVSEDLIDRLSRLRWLPVIARSSSFALEADSIDAKAAGAALGARYVLKGWLRLRGSVLSLSVELADAETSKIIWSNRVQLDDMSAPETLENLLSGLTNALGAKIDAEEQSRVLQKPQSDLNVRDLIWRGRWHLNRLSQADARAARECFAKALAFEPNSPEAIIQSTWARLWDLWATRGSEGDIREVRQMAQKAIIADYDDARGHMLAGITECWLKQPLRSEAHLRHAIELNPSLVLAHAQLGDSRLLRGDPDAALSSLNLAMRLSPNDQHLFFFHGELAIASLMLADYDVALEHAEASLNRRSAYWFSHVVRINALCQLNRIEDAKRAMEELMFNNSSFELRHIDWIPFVESRWNELLKDGLNRAGARSD